MSLSLKGRAIDAFEVGLKCALDRFETIIMCAERHLVWRNDILERKVPNDTLCLS